MNQNQQTTAQQALFKPRRVAVKLHYTAINQFCYMWVEHDRPFDFHVKESSRNRELLGICFDVANFETVDFLKELPDNIRGVEIIDI